MGVCVVCCVVCCVYCVCVFVWCVVCGAGSVCVWEVLADVCGVCVLLHTHKSDCLATASTPYPRPLFSTNKTTPPKKERMEKVQRLCCLVCAAGLRRVIVLPKCVEPSKHAKYEKTPSRTYRVAGLGCFFFPSAFIFRERGRICFSQWETYPQMRYPHFSEISFFVSVYVQPDSRGGFVHEGRCSRTA